MSFEVKDSGKRAEFNGGMVRDTSEGKLRPDLVRDGPMYLRWVKHLTAGAVKYTARNWMLGIGDEPYDRALESADRHFMIWYTWRRYGVNIEDVDKPTREPLKEDHAAAVMFNINSVEYYADREKPVDMRQLVEIKQNISFTRCRHGGICKYYNTLGTEYDACYKSCEARLRAETPSLAP